MEAASTWQQGGPLPSILVSLWIGKTGVLQMPDWESERVFHTSAAFSQISSLCVDGGRQSPGYSK